MTTNAAVQLSVKTSLVGVRLFQSPNHMNGAVHKRVIERLRAHLVETYSAEFVGSVASPTERHVSMSFIVPTAMIASMQNTVTEQKTLWRVINDWYTCFLLNPGVRFADMQHVSPYRQQDLALRWLNGVLTSRVLCFTSFSVFPPPGYEQVQMALLTEEKDCTLYDNTGRTWQLLSVWQQSKTMN